MKEQVAEIVAAYLRKNHVTAGDIPAVITQVHQSLAQLGQSQPAETPLQPAVPIRRSVNPEYIVCLDCGAKAKMLRRHLASAHNMTPADYRQRWSLPPDYPVVAASYAARRSEMAKAAGLGRKSAAAGQASGRAKKRT